MIHVKGQCPSCPAFDDCQFIGDLVVIPVECEKCIEKALDRVEAESRKMDEDLKTMRRDIDGLQVEMKKFDEKMKEFDETECQIRKIVCEPVLEMPDFTKKNEMITKMIEEMNKAIQKIRGCSSAGTSA